MGGGSKGGGAVRLTSRSERRALLGSGGGLGGGGKGGVSRSARLTSLPSLPPSRTRGLSFSLIVATIVSKHLSCSRARTRPPLWLCPSSMPSRRLVTLTVCCAHGGMGSEVGRGDGWECTRQAIRSFAAHLHVCVEHMEVLAVAHPAFHPL